MKQADPGSLPVLQRLLIIGSSEIGSLLPDIDEPNSKAGRKVKPVSSLIKSAAGHRGVFHSPFIVILLYAVLEAVKTALLKTQPSLNHLYFISVYDAITTGFICGYISHLFLDMLNARGIPLLWPLSNRRFHLLKLRTNRDEGIVIVLMIDLTIMCQTF